MSKQKTRQRKPKRGSGLWFTMMAAAGIFGLWHGMQPHQPYVSEPVALVQYTATPTDAAAINPSSTPQLGQVTEQPTLIPTLFPTPTQAVNTPEPTTPPYLINNPNIPVLLRNVPLDELVIWPIFSPQQYTQQSQGHTVPAMDMDGMDREEKAASQGGHNFTRTVRRTTLISPVTGIVQDKYVDEYGGNHLVLQSTGGHNIHLLHLVPGRNVDASCTYNEIVKDERTGTERQHIPEGGFASISCSYNVIVGIGPGDHVQIGEPIGVVSNNGYSFGFVQTETGVRNVRCPPNTECGWHVHMETDGQSPYEFMKAQYKKYPLPEPELPALVPWDPSRITYNGCPPDTQAAIDLYLSQYGRALHIDSPLEIVCSPEDYPEPEDSKIVVPKPDWYKPEEPPEGMSEEEYATIPNPAGVRIADYLVPFYFRTLASQAFPGLPISDETIIAAFPALFSKFVQCYSPDSALCVRAAMAALTNVTTDKMLCQHDPNLGTSEFAPLECDAVREYVLLP